jgi:serine/threonine protein kinase
MNVAFRDSDAKAWFESEPEWANRVGEGWKGTKILGRGSKGVAGLWEYRPENFDLSNAPTVRQMVVKMTELDDSDEQNRRRLEGPKTAFDEGNIGVKIAQIGSRHLVRQYGGSRLGDCFGEMGGVVKIFLEFCPGGDLEQFFPRNEEEERNPRLPIHEYDLWSLFHCMAVAIAAMERGTEDIKASSWNGELHDTEFMHCDLKMDNGKSPSNVDLHN